MAWHDFLTSPLPGDTISSLGAWINKRVLFIVKNLYTMERLGVMQIAAQARLRGWEADLAVTDGTAYGDLLRRVRN